MTNRDGTPATGGDGDEPQVGVLVTGDDTGGRLALVELRERRDAGPPRHLHHWEDEVVYVLAGAVTFFRGDEQLPASAGSCVLLPRGQEHNYRVESDGARLLVAVVPAGFEACYQEVTWTGGDTSVERLIAVAARYGVEVTGPPPDPTDGLPAATPSVPSGGR